MADQFGKLNALEKRAFNAEESASEVRWQVADEIVRLIGTGLTQGEVAEGWINLKTGRPYASQTVSKYARIVAAAPAGSSRGDFLEAFYIASPGSDTAGMARLPKNEAGLADHIQRASQKLYDEYDRAPSEIAGLVHANFRTGEDKPSKRITAQEETPAQANYRKAREARELVRSITEPAGAKAETVLQALANDIEILLGVLVR